MRKMPASGHSAAMPNTVVQGISPHLPCKAEFNGASAKLRDLRHRVKKRRASQKKKSLWFEHNQKHEHANRDSGIGFQDRPQAATLTGQESTVSPETQDFTITCASGTPKNDMSRQFNSQKSTTDNSIHERHSAQKERSGSDARPKCLATLKIQET